MEFLYVAQWNGEVGEIILPPAEEKHCRALRLRDDEPVGITNGNGSKGIIRYRRGDRQPVHSVLESEERSSVQVALGIIEHKDRWEFALEKLVEVGCRRIIPLASHFTQKKTINSERSLAKMIAALKQCGRAYLPELADICSVEEAIEQYAIGGTSYLAKAGDYPTTNSKEDKATIFIGPEGGFSPDEEKILVAGGAIPLSLGRVRLRAETAAIVAAVLIQN